MWVPCQCCAAVVVVGLGVTGPHCHCRLRDGDGERATATAERAGWFRVTRRGPVWGHDEYTCHLYACEHHEMAACPSELTMCCALDVLVRADKMMEMPFGVARLLGADTELLHVQVIGRVGEASFNARLKHGREVHVDARLRVHDLVIDATRALGGEWGSKVRVGTSMTTSWMGEAATFYIDGEIGVAAKLSVEDVDVFGVVTGSTKAAVADHARDRLKWWLDTEQAGARIQALVAVDTSDWLQHKVTGVRNRYNNDWHTRLRPVATLLSSILDDFDVRLLVLPQTGSITTIKRSPNAEPGAAPEATWNGGKIWVAAPYSMEPVGNGKRHVVVSLGDLTPESVVGDSLEDSTEPGFVVRHLVKFANAIVSSASPCSPFRVPRGKCCLPPRSLTPQLDDT